MKTAKAHVKGQARVWYSQVCGIMRRLWIRDCSAFLLWEWTWWCLGVSCELNGLFWEFPVGKSFAAKVGDRWALKEKQGSRGISWHPLASTSGWCFLLCGNAAEPGQAVLEPEGHPDPPRAAAGIPSRQQSRWFRWHVGIAFYLNLDIFLPGLLWF